VSVLDIQSIRNASLKSIALLILIALPLHGAAKTATSSTYNVTRDIVYGDPQDAYSELQSLDIYWQDNKVARPVIIIPGNATTRQTIDVELGTSKDAPSGALMAFIRATF
jgi:hypothetical protein